LSDVVHARAHVHYSGLDLRLDLHGASLSFTETPQSPALMFVFTFMFVS
jgi:hypothetical protein